MHQGYESLSTGWSVYAKKYRLAAKSVGKTRRYVEICLEYAKPLYEAGFPVIFSAGHLASLLGIKYEYLLSMAYSANHFYRSFTIPKKSGGKRRIDEPLPDLKMIQRWILDNVLVAAQAQISPYAKAFIVGRSIKDSARFHRNQDVVLKTDIKDFFSSIDRLDVFQAFSGFGYSDKLSWVLTNLCCYDGGLPQGAPTSPCLSNIVLREIDEQVGVYCQEKKYRYTRYADDVTISGNVDVSATLSYLSRLYLKHGLFLNSGKTAVLRRSNRQEVVGVVVNSHMQAPRTYRRKIRQEIHYIKKFGLEDHLSKVGEKRAKYLLHLLGKINYVLFLNSCDKEMLSYKIYVIYLLNISNN